MLPDKQPTEKTRGREGREALPAAQPPPTAAPRLGPREPLPAGLRCPHSPGARVGQRPGTAAVPGRGAGDPGGPGPSERRSCPAGTARGAPAPPRARRHLSPDPPAAAGPKARRARGAAPGPGGARRSGVFRLGETLTAAGSQRHSPRG